MDTMRALCMLWIIAIWHIGRYLETGRTFVPYNEYTECITTGILATFTFLSGYFLGGGKIFCLKDALLFYKQRIKRFYLLFFISCLSIYVACAIFHQEGIVSVRQLLFTLTGINCFIGDMPPTIWYFSMLIIFYLITPVVNYCKTNRNKIILSVSIEIIFVLWHICFHSDERVILYFPVYCAALICSGAFTINSKYSLKVFALGMFCSVASIRVYVQFPQIFILNYLVGLSVLTVVSEISKLITRQWTERIFTILSYSSMCGYLFHRQFYGALQILFGNFSWWFAYLTVIPLFLVASFVLQVCYDRMVLHKDSFLRKRRY